MGKKTNEEKKMIHEEVDSLHPQVKTQFIASARIEVLERLLVQKGILTVEEMEEEGFEIMEKRLKEI